MFWDRFISSTGTYLYKSANNNDNSSIAYRCAGLLLFNYIQIFIDFLRPKLNWENEQAALKQNFNTFLEMLIVILLGAGIGIIGVLLYIKTGISIYVLGVGMVVFLFITTIVVAKLIALWGAKELYSLE